MQLRIDRRLVRRSRAAGFLDLALHVSSVAAVSLAAPAALPARALADQTIATAVEGPVFSDGGFLTVTATGSVVSPAASNVGVSVSGGLPITTLTNDGLVQAPYNGTSFGVDNQVSIGTLINRGQIDGAYSAVRNTGALARFVNSGTLGYFFSYQGVSNSGAIGTLENSGYIPGLFNQGEISRLDNSGRIEGNAWGIQNLGRIGAIDNSGTIGEAFSGLSNSGEIGSFVNTGTMIGVASGGGGFPIVVNLGRIAGDVDIGGQNLTLVGGSGSSVGTTVTGGLSVPDGRLDFAGGSSVVGQSIIASSLSNEAALAVGEDIGLRGDFVQSASGALDLEDLLHGHVSVGGTAFLAGSLGLRDIATGADVLVFAASALSGDFAGLSVDGSACSETKADVWSCPAAGLILSERRSGGDLFFGAAAIPELSTWALATLGFAGLAVFRHRSARKAMGPPPAVSRSPASKTSMAAPLSSERRRPESRSEAAVVKSVAVGAGANQIARTPSL